MEYTKPKFFHRWFVSLISARKVDRYFSKLLMAAQMLFVFC